MLMPLAATPAPAVMPTRAGDALIRIEQVTKRFGSTPVLEGIDLVIGDGEFVALLGPSGCGKTTLLRILCGIESASSGRVWLGGQDITRWSPAARGFGVVFQSYALFPNLSAAQNVAYGLAGMTREHAAGRVREMLDLVGLAAQAGYFPAQLSGGQQQRIALARALAPSPRLVLLDEPLSALDAQVRAHLRGEIRAICSRLGVSTVMVTHDQEEALSMADRVVLMHRGRIEQAGTPAELYARPRTAFVAGFVGRMNLWQATALGAETARVGTVALDARRPDADESGAGEAPALVPGQRVRVGIRPEQVLLLPHEPAWDRTANSRPLPANTVLAEVRETGFHGAHLTLSMFCEAMNVPISAELPTPPSARSPYRVKDRVRLHFPAAALTLMPGG